MKTKVLTIFAVLILVVALIASLTGCQSTGAHNAPATPAPTTRTITDMYGRQITVPTTINRVLGTSPIEMELVYMLAPDKLVGLAVEVKGQPPLVPEKYSSLPVIGGWFGTQTGNYETFIAAKPDIILEGFESSIAERQEKFGSIPVVGVNAGDYLTNYENEVRFLGDLLGVQAQAQSLITYYKDAMQYVENVVSGIPDNARVKVYYAEGKDGFSTDPSVSMHTKLLEFCGGENVAKVTLIPGYGMAETSLEQIALWDPDMIIIGRSSQATLYQTIMTDSKWSQLKAVKNKQVFLRPDNPLSWFDGPPGPCQIIGLYWMVHTLYPDKTKDLDLGAKVKEFYAKFLHYQLTDAEVAGLLANPS